MPPFPFPFLNQPAVLAFRRSRTALRLYGFTALYGYSGGQNFQRRFLVLRGPFMLNYVSEEHTDPKGIIMLDGARLVVTPGVPSPVKKQPAVKRALMSFLTNEDKRTPFSFTVARPSGMRYEVRLTID